MTAVNQSYPGRACMAPLLDLLMTLLHMGAEGWRDALRAREDVFPYLRDRLREVAAEHGACVLARRLRVLERAAPDACPTQASACWTRPTTRYRSR